MGFVHAYHRGTGEKQWVPEHYIDNPHVFGGAFTLTPSARAKARKKSGKRSDPAPVAPVETPAVDSSAPTEPPADGDTTEGVTPDA